MCRVLNIFVVPFAEKDRGDVTSIRLLSRSEKRGIKGGGWQCIQITAACVASVLSQKQCKYQKVLFKILIEILVEQDWEDTGNPALERQNALCQFDTGNPIS